MPSDDAAGRIVGCGGIHNFRDYGGYVAGQGRLRTGMLFRSAQHFDAAPGDLRIVDGLGLAVVIDLRGRSERAEAPCPRPAGFAAEIVAIDEETVQRAPHLDAARAAMTATQARQAMAEGYRTMPFRPVLVRLYTRYFEALSRIDGPSLIHCLAGKDRTGLAVALLHHLAGVHPDDMMEDYMMTNVAGNIDARVAAGGRHIKRFYGDLNDDALRALMSVEPLYLEAALAAIVERHGTVDAYLHDVLGVSAERRDAIMARIVV